MDYVLCMTVRRPKTTETLARNLNFLMDKYSYSEREVSKRSGVAPKTVNNMRNARTTSTIENVDKVASVFGLSGWQMIVPDLPSDLVESRQLKSTLSNYMSADTEGRQAIDRLAEREAAYTAKK
jgi:transcriptional regulator with XRE-family HTH domain